VIKSMLSHLHLGIIITCTSYIFLEILGAHFFCQVFTMTFESIRNYEHCGDYCYVIAFPKHLRRTMKSLCVVWVYHLRCNYMDIIYLN